MDWLVGVYYAEEDVDWRDGVQYGQSAPIYFGALFRDPTLGALYAPNATTDGNVMQIGQSGETFAVFTHNIVDFTDRLQFVFGLRYTEETKDGTGTFNATSGPIALPFAAFPLPLRLSNDWAARFQDDAFSGTASMRYSWTDDVSTYLSYSRGFKSGGFSFERDGGGSVFSTDPTTDPSCIANGPPISPGGGGLPPIFACEGLIPEFGSETVDSFELGLRSVLADGALTLNATAFHSKYSDFQVTQFTGVGFVVTNAGSVTSKGFEIEATGARRWKVWIFLPPLLMQMWHLVRELTLAPPFPTLRGSHRVRQQSGNPPFQPITVGPSAPVLIFSSQHPTVIPARL